MNHALLIRGCVLACTGIALALATGCKKQDEKFGITGRVAVQDGDASGVTVELYAAPVFASTDVWTTTADNPSVGFPYRYQAHWDYRRHQSRLVAGTATGADGSFEFPEVADGDYVVHTRKSGFGWSVPVVVKMRGGNVNAGTLSLAPEIVQPPGTVIDGDVRWLAGRHYVIQSKVTVAQGATLTIEPGAVVRLVMDGWIEVLGTLVAHGEPDRCIVFTSNETLPDQFDWAYIKFSENAAPPSFRYCTISYSEDGIRSTKPGGIIEYCCFLRLGAQAVSLRGIGASSDSLVFRRNVIDQTPSGLRITNLDSLRPSAIEYNAIFNARPTGGIRIEVARSGNVRCNWFYNCGASGGDATGALYVRDARNLVVERNEFVYGWYGIEFGSLVDASVQIRNNHFLQNYYAIMVGWTADAYGASNPRINFNCFETIDHYHLYVDACNINRDSIDASNNYWDGRSETAVRASFVYDRDDNPICPRVTVTPVMLVCPRSEVGVCGS